MFVSVWVCFGNEWHILASRYLLWLKSIHTQSMVWRIASLLSCVNLSVVLEQQTCHCIFIKLSKNMFYIGITPPDTKKNLFAATLTVSLFIGTFVFIFFRRCCWCFLFLNYYNYCIFLPLIDRLMSGWIMGKVTAALTNMVRFC